MPNNLDQTHCCKDLRDNVNNFLYKLGNEPSVAGYRIQEHVYKTIPTLIKEQYEVSAHEQKISGTSFDMDYTREFLKKLDESIHISRNTREKISELASKISAINAKHSGKKQ